MNPHPCKRCLLQDAQAAFTNEMVAEFISALPPELQTPPDENMSRLDECRRCEHLLAGTCLLCGCYVEMRAAMRTMHCPDIDNPKW